MNQQVPDFRGKQLFKDQVNKSDKHNMYPVLEQDQGGNDLFYKRVQDDYSPKHDIEYVPPPVVKNL